MSLEGKVVLITGGSKGIGRAIALRAAQSGASVVVNYSSDTGAANEVVAQIGSDRALAVRADASSVAGVEELVRETVGRFSKVDVAIPNAGMMTMQDLEHTSEAGFDSMYNLNVKGPSFWLRSAVPPSYLLYASAKGAVEQMTRVMAKDLARKGITGKPDAMVKAIAAQSPFNRLGDPADIADVAAFLAGPESRWVSGQVIAANGAAFV
ncbi:hypothetical protein DL764_004065 [Monosporascus ibericus]|uniref:Uncharacterized protein n=1 Tax=Monosporascus ibericus TaxID=155417 RepID=A0A4Q4TE46_9PEZI|nr:hypothetical protein DL764_004065 [Monosporascus ibericus]